MGSLPVRTFSDWKEQPGYLEMTCALRRHGEGRTSAAWWSPTCAPAGERFHCWRASRSWKAGIRWHLRQEAFWLSRRPKMGSRIPVRTLFDWKDPEPGYLEIDWWRTARHGDRVVISSLVVTDVCSGWTEAIPLLAREQTLGWWTGRKLLHRLIRAASLYGREQSSLLRGSSRSRSAGINSDNDSVFINETLLGYCEERGIEFTRSRAYRKNDQAWIEQKQPSLMSRPESGRIPVVTRPCHGVEDGQQLPCTRSESHLLRLSGFQQPLVEVA